MRRAPGGGWRVGGVWKLVGPKMWIQPGVPETMRDVRPLLSQMGTWGCTEQKRQLGSVLRQPQLLSGWWYPALAQHPAGLHTRWPSLWPQESQTLLLTLLISTSLLPSLDDALPGQPRGGEPPSGQPPGSPVLGFPGFPLTLEQIKAR